MFWSNPGSKDGVTCKLPVVRGESACTPLSCPRGSPAATICRLASLGPQQMAEQLPPPGSLERVHTLEVLLHLGRSVCGCPIQAAHPAPGRPGRLVWPPLCQAPNLIGGSVVWLTNSRCLSDSPKYDRPSCLHEAASTSVKQGRSQPSSAVARLEKHVYSQLQ